MFGKYFASTFTGSMVGAGPCTFAVWGYVIANCKNGTVEINPTILAAILGTTKEDVDKSIEYLTAPDPASRSKVLDGRRLVKVGAFFYEVPNHATYRGILNDEERREYFRDKKREQRERDAKAKLLEKVSLTVKDMSNMSTQAEAYADSDSDAEASLNKSPIPPSKARRLRVRRKSSSSLRHSVGEAPSSKVPLKVPSHWIEENWDSLGYGKSSGPWDFDAFPAPVQEEILQAYNQATNQ